MDIPTPPSIEPGVASLGPFGSALSLNTSWWCGLRPAGRTCYGPTFQEGWGWFWVAAPLWKSLFLQGRTLWFCLSGKQPVQVPVSRQGEGNVQGPELQLLQHSFSAGCPCHSHSQSPLLPMIVSSGHQCRLLGCSGLWPPLLCSSIHTRPSPSSACLKSSIDGTTFLFPSLPWVYFLGF